MFTFITTLDFKTKGTDVQDLNFSVSRRHSVGIYKQNNQYGVQKNNISCSYLLKTEIKIPSIGQTLFHFLKISKKGSLNLGCLMGQQVNH